MTTTLIPKADLDKIVKLDDTVRTGRKEIAQAREEGNDTVASFVQARMLQQMREQLQGPMMADIMQLRGTALGFVTDRDHKGQQYSEEEVRDCVIEALAHGFRLVNNEMNIIAGRFYAAKSGMKRLLRELVTDLKIDIGQAEGTGKRWLVPATASWRHRGVPDSLERVVKEHGDFRIAVPLRETDTPSNVEGRAEARMLRLIHARVTGSDITVAGDVDDSDVIDAESFETTPELEEGITGDRQNEISSFFDGCEAILQINEMENLLVKESSSDEEREFVQRTAEARRGQIRAARGERAGSPA